MTSMREIADATINLCKTLQHSDATEWHVAKAFCSINTSLDASLVDQINARAAKFLDKIPKFETDEPVNVQFTTLGFSLLKSLGLSSNESDVLKRFLTAETGNGGTNRPRKNPTKHEEPPILKAPPIPRDKAREEALEELGKLTGLPKVKKEIKNWVNRCIVDHERVKRGMPSLLQDQWLTFAFMGAPGTGKTTVARVVAKLFYGLGFIETPNLVEVTRAQLIGKYVGQTAPLVVEACKTADGGVLFIDEAYSLYSDSPEDYGHEAIAELLVQTNNRKKTMATIIAGYGEPMQKLIDSNPGLSSRFPKNNRLEFEDYTPADLVSLVEKHSAGFGISFAEGVKEAVIAYFEAIQKSPNFGNAREAISLVNIMYNNLSDRVIIDGEVKIDLLDQFVVSDVPNPPAKPTAKDKNPIGFQRT